MGLDWAKMNIEDISGNKIRKKTSPVSRYSRWSESEGPTPAPPPFPYLVT